MAKKTEPKKHWYLSQIFLIIIGVIVSAAISIPCTYYITKSSATPMASFVERYRDKTLLRFKNVTKGDKDYRECISADIEDRISFCVLVANKSKDVIARSPKVFLHFTGNKNNKLQFRADLTAENAKTIHDEGYVNVPESGLGFLGDAKATVYLNSLTYQYESETRYTGTGTYMVEIDDLLPGWSGSGYIVFRGKVGRIP